MEFLSLLPTQDLANVQCCFCSRGHTSEFVRPAIPYPYRIAFRRPGQANPSTIAIVFVKLGENRRLIGVI
jgi:hypothetical protein